MNLHEDKSYSLFFKTGGKIETTYYIFFINFAKI